MLKHYASLGAEALKDGASLQIGFNYFQLKLTGERELTVLSPDFDDPRTIRSTLTANLTKALWVHLMHATVAGTTGLTVDDTFLLDDVAIQQAVVTALADGEDIEMLFERLPLSDDQRFFHDGTRRSGWMLTTPHPVEGEDARRLRNVDAGALLALAPGVIPYLGLPVGTTVHLSGNTMHSVSIIDEEKAAEFQAANPTATMGEFLSAPGTNRVLLVGALD